MKIKNILNKKDFYLGASGIKIPSVYNKELPKKKKLPKVKKSVYGVDSSDGGNGGAE